MKQPGFTLIEVMITVVIVTIMAAVALPAYTSSVVRSRLTGAKTGLSSFAVQLETYYQDHRKYQASGTTCGIATPATNDDAFTYSCSTDAATGQTFLLTATGKAAKRMQAYSFTLDQQNNRRTTGFPGLSAGKDCWIDNAGDPC